MNDEKADAVYGLANLDGESCDLIGLGRAVRVAIEVIEDAIDTYGEHLSLSFNGGKDCTVLLHIYAAVLHRHRRRVSPSSATSTTATTPLSIPTIYIPMPSPFPEMEAFIEASAELYTLDLFRVPCAEGSSGKKGMKEALELYGHVKPGVKAILIGIRRGDPFSERLTHNDLTDKDWPEFMRVHPIIDWTYAQVWRFLRVLEVDYCSLYDQGYTSLGSTYNTYPNPALKVEGESNDSRVAMFKPAYDLEDGNLERCGRISGPPQTPVVPPSQTVDESGRQEEGPQSSLPTTSRCHQHVSPTESTCKVERSHT